MRQLGTPFISLTILLFATNAYAQAWSGTVNTISTPVATNGFIFRPILAVEPNGNAYAIWNRVAGSPPNTLIQAARYIAATDTWGAPMTLSGPAAFGPPEVAVDANGNAFFLMARAAGGSSQIQVIRYEPTSGAMTPTILSSSGSSAAFGQVVVDTNGNAIVVWDEPAGIHGARYDAQLATWGSSVKISEEGGSIPRLAIDGENDVTVVWSRRPPSSTNFVIQTARFDSTTLTWSSPIDLSAPGQIFGGARVAADPAGNVTALWARLNGVHTIVQAARFVKATGTWSTAADLSAPGASAEAVNVAADLDGHVIAIWRRAVGVTYVIQTTRFDTNLGSWSSVIDLTLPNGLPYPIPQVKFDADGNALALWGFSRPGSGIQMQGARYTAASNQWSAPVDLSAAGQAALNPDVGFDAAGNGTAAWFQSAGGLGVIQTTRWLNVPPNAPTDLVVTSVTGNTVTLAWNAPSGGGAPTGYVLVGGLQPGSLLASIPTGSNTTRFTFTAPSGVFFVRLHALSGNLRSAASNEIQLVVNAPLPPSPPASLLGLVNGSRLALSWTNTFLGGAPAALQLNVTGAQSASIPLGVSDLVSFNGVPGGTYTFTLTASNASGVSAPSNPVTLTFPGTCSGAPGVPTFFAVTKVSSLLTISWNPPVSGSALTNYIVQASGAFTGSIPTFTRSLSGTVGPGTYSLSVAAANACGMSAFTNVVTVTVP
jgi:hypothetical protein